MPKKLVNKGMTKDEAIRKINNRIKAIGKEVYPDAQSGQYAQGKIDGLKEALEYIDKIFDYRDMK